MVASIVGKTFDEAQRIGNSKGLTVNWTNEGGSMYYLAYLPNGNDKAGFTTQTELLEFVHNYQPSTSWNMNIVNNSRKSRGISDPAKAEAKKMLRYGFKVDGKFRSYATKEAAENALREAKERSEMANVLIGNTQSQGLSESEKAAFADWERRHPRQ